MTDRNFVVIMNDVGRDVCRFSHPVMVICFSLRDILTVHKTLLLKFLQLLR